MKAIWNDIIIAESNDIVNVEGNSYFPLEAVRKEYLVNSETKTHCYWKGMASYYSLNAGGKENVDAAWYYPEPGDKAKSIKGRVAFWRGVQVVKD